MANMTESPTYCKQYAMPVAHVGWTFMSVALPCTALEAETVELQRLFVIWTWRGLCLQPSQITVAVSCREGKTNNNPPPG